MTATPPFNIDQTLPGDSDIVSQHPSNARTFRDVAEQWLLTEHNVNGRHDKVSLDHSAALTGIASVSRVWASSDSTDAGELKKIIGSGGSAEYVGVPPGSVQFYAGSTVPNGWLNANGAAVSRTTYARLFTAISTTYGVGDGSTTFNLPDITGRAIFGKESAATRITNAGSSIVGSTLGATGGAETVTLAQANLPNATLTASVSGTPSSSGHSFISPLDNSTGTNFGGTGSGTLYRADTQYTAIGAITSTGTTSSINGNVTQTAVNKMPPAIILIAMIKT